MSRYVRSASSFVPLLLAVGGGLLAVAGLALALNLFSLRAVLAEQGNWRGLVWVSQLHDWLGSSSSQLIEMLFRDFDAGILGGRAHQDGPFFGKLNVLGNDDG